MREWLEKAVEIAEAVLDQFLTLASKASGDRAKDVRVHFVAEASGVNAVISALQKEISKQEE